jgi:hypothetical protein
MSMIEFMRRRLNGRTWAVAKVRRGRVMRKYDVVLLPREWETLKAEYAALG